ncbi:MAG: S49 family peptidase [Actinomycetota bacterium]|jgi:protease-4|nr:S49 family peptidase [Actinomycetota bacterium]
MSSIFDTFANTLRFLRNVFASLLRRPPNFVWLDINGPLPEFEQRVSFIQKRLGRTPAGSSLEGIRDKLRLLSADGRTKGVVLRVRGLDAGWASIEELRRELLAYRERGGKVVAYLVEGGTPAYYLASAADEIIATPLATLDITGVRTSATFLRDAFEKIGVEAEVVAVSPYKSAYDRFTRNDFSDEAREQAGRLLDGRFSALVEAISESRNISPEETKRKIDNAPYPAREAVSERLLDGVCYEDELPERLAADGKKAKLTEWGIARKALKTPYLRGGGKKVGVVSLSGAIMRGKSRNFPVPLPLVGGRQAGDESVVAALRMAEKNASVGSVLFHVESGGGDALASDLIWREVERIRGKKPVVVLMGNVAGSGGYYVGAAADWIVVRRNTITGSIGVISLRPVAEGLYEKLGVGSDSVERGARSGFLDPSRRPTPEEMRVLENQIGAIYEEFKDRVMTGRGIEASALENIAGGRVWTGAEAHELGLADEVGGFAEAFRKARELGGIKREGSEAMVKISPPKKGRGPSPGDPSEAARLAIEEVREDANRLLETKIWLASPYEFSDE